MAIYKDKAGHFTSKDNAGGECRHGVEGKTAKLKGQGAYAEWARSINPEATDKDILEGMADKYEDIDIDGGEGKKYYYTFDAEFINEGDEQALKRYGINVGFDDNGNITLKGTKEGLKGFLEDYVGVDLLEDYLEDEDNYDDRDFSPYGFGSFSEAFGNKRDFNESIAQEGKEEEVFDESEESKPTETPKRTASDRTYPYKATSKKGTALSSALGGDFTQSKYDKNIFEGEDGSEYVVATEEEAKELAKDEIKDFFEEAGIEGYTPDFQENIIASHIDEDELYDFLQEADPENADFLRDNPGALVEWLKENDMMGQLNGMVNVDSMAEDALEWDGIGHFLAQYDGEEIDLGNGLFAYRRN